MGLEKDLGLEDADSGIPPARQEANPTAAHAPVSGYVELFGGTTTS